jgi:hypothetical protein
MLYNDKFEFFSKTIPENIDPNTEIEIFGKKTTVGEIHELCPIREKKFSLYMDWDDICSYTSFGILDLINEAYPDKKIDLDIKSFFKRTEPYGLNYLKYICRETYNSATIEAIYQNYFTDICMRSPTTDLFKKIDRARLMFSSLTIGFRYDLPELTEFIMSIQKDKFGNKIACDYVILPDRESREKYYRRGTHDIYCVADAGQLYADLIHYDVKKKAIMTFEHHHGIHEFIFAIYVHEFLANEINGPNEISIQFMKEIPDEIGDKENESRSLEFKQRIGD